MTAFQSIQLGIFNNTPTHDRYDINQLAGQSILIQNGQTELGLAVIELAIAFGADQIFATAPSEYHPRLRNAGATPLGAESFRWELFLTEKLFLVLLQDMPSTDNFEHFSRLLDDDTGCMVKINHWPQQQGGEEDNDNNIHDIGGCDGGSPLQDLAEKARNACERAKFHLRLACSPNFLTYEGVWASSKQDPNLWKEDLRFLLALLSDGTLSPRVYERICLEDVAEIQDRIELYGKDHASIVCLPFKTATETAFAVDRSKNTGALSTLPEHSLMIKERSASGGREELKCSTATCLTARWSESENNGIDFDRGVANEYEVDDFAIDSGYAKRSPVDTLADFRYITRNQTQAPSVKHTIQHMPFHHKPRVNQPQDFTSVSRRLLLHDNPNNNSSANVDRYCEKRSQSSLNSSAAAVTDTKSRRNKINQLKERRHKAQHNSNSHYDNEAPKLHQPRATQVKNVPRSQRRKLRRDAKTKSETRGNMANSQVIADCETVPSENSHWQSITDESDVALNIEESNVKLHEKTSQTFHALQSAAERKMQALDSSCSSTHEPSTSASSAVILDEPAAKPPGESKHTKETSLQLKEKMNSLPKDPRSIKQISCMASKNSRSSRVTKGGINISQPAAAAKRQGHVEPNFVEKDTASSFHSLMNKWKHIEGGQL